MAARSAAAATAACHALRRALRVDKLLAQASRLRNFYDYCFLGAGGSSSSTSSATAAAVGAVLCAAAALFPRAAAFFLPLVASTSLCCAAAWLFAAEAAKEEAAGGGVEVVRAGGGKAAAPEPGLLQVIGDANASAYGVGGGPGGVQVGCFLRRSARCGVDEDGDEVVFAGTLAPRCAAGGGALEMVEMEEEQEEELAALRVDSLAQGVWDSYFGGWSRWHDAYAAY